MKCHTCQEEATFHIRAIGCHFCASCLQKIDARIAEMNRQEPTAETPTAAGNAVQLLQPHEQRVVQEKLELDEKIRKLTVFLDGIAYTQLDEGEKVRLKLQFKIMNLYSSILGDRIAAFKS